MKAVPQIQKYMTAMPHTIGQNVSIKKALEMLREYQIRHLPVQDSGKLVGVITDRDIKLASSFQGAQEFQVEEVMTPDPYTVSPEAALDEVIQTMAEHKFGCAIVKQPNGKVVGIYTEIDAYRTLIDLIKAHYKN